MASEELPFRQAIRHRLLVEMLRGVKLQSKADWQVLIVDDYTTKVMSSTCRMAELTDEGVSLVEDLKKKRQPQPLLDAVYFIQPTQQSAKFLAGDMGGAKALYRRAHIFFSSPVPSDVLQLIKDNTLLRERLAGLKEMNLEISTVDMQGFTTDQPDALVQLFGESTTNRTYERCIDLMATRIATVFASLKEFPSIRYRAAKSSSTASGTPERARALIPTKLAAAVWDRVQKYKAKLADSIPQRDSCDLLIIDRSSDPVTPFIHDWSYGGLAFDVLEDTLDGNRYTLQMTTESGKVESRVAILDEHDSMWMELRDLFIGEALQKVTSISDSLIKRRTQKDQSTKQMRENIANLGKYTELKDKVDLHVMVAGKVMETIKKENLMEIGKLEQGFVFGDSTATFKELMRQFQEHKDEMTAETKQRLLGVYAATHPEKFDTSKRLIWKKSAEITDEEMLSVTNLDHLGVSAVKESQGKMGLTFGKRSASGVQRLERRTEEGIHELMRFYPVIQDLLEDMHKNVLDKDLYPYVQPPREQSKAPAGGTGGSSWAEPKSERSGRSVRTPLKPSGSGSGSKHGGEGGPAMGITTKGGRRMFVFMIGGMTRSELRAAHIMSQELRREVVIGSTWLEVPKHWLEAVGELNGDPE